MLSSLIDAGRNLFVKTDNTQTSVLQRRRGMRFACSTPVNCQVRHSALQGRMLDVSQGGVRLQVTRELRRGAELILKPDPTPASTHDECVSVPIRIVWIRRIRDTFEVGATFTMPAGLKASWVGRHLRQLSAGAGLNDKRTTRRYRTRLMGGIRMGNSTVNVSLPGVVNDISMDGALFTGNLSAEVGTPIVLKLGSPDQIMVVPGRIMRVRTNGPRALVGIRFDALPYPQRCVLARFLGNIMEERPTKS